MKDYMMKDLIEEIHKEVNLIRKAKGLDLWVFEEREYFFDEMVYNMSVPVFTRGKKVSARKKAILYLRAGLTPTRVVELTGLHRNSVYRIKRSVILEEGPEVFTLDN